MKYHGKLPVRVRPEEKLDIIQLARYSGLGFQKTLTLFGIKPHRVWRHNTCNSAVRWRCKNISRKVFNRIK